MQFTPDQNTDRHRRIIVRARDVAAGESHHHERRADREWRDHPRTTADYRTSNCQNEEERPDKFGDILVHRSIPTGHSLEKARHIGNETLVLSAVRNTAERTTSHLIRKR